MLRRIQSAFERGSFVAGPHSRLKGLQRGIMQEHLVTAVGNDAPEILEEDPNDPRGPSCLIRGELEDGTVIHVVTTTVEEPFFVITHYHPDELQWYPGFRERIQP